jgi:hypothetical protein
MPWTPSPRPAGARSHGRSRDRPPCLRRRRAPRPPLATPPGAPSGHVTAARGAHVAAATAGHVPGRQHVDPRAMGVAQVSVQGGVRVHWFLCTGARSELADVGDATGRRRTPRRCRRFEPAGATRRRRSPAGSAAGRRRTDPRVHTNQCSRPSSRVRVTSEFRAVPRAPCGHPGCTVGRRRPESTGSPGPGARERIAADRRPRRGPSSTRRPREPASPGVRADPVVAPPVDARGPGVARSGSRRRPGVAPGARRGPAPRADGGGRGADAARAGGAQA